ncbi:P-loop containing nucleoside triphosphate hydrolase protein [Coemansia spiralis]|nr:P-loop containing nucleoside triphosphate hydrolase protein [Coemansia spiralis]
MKPSTISGMQTEHLLPDVDMFEEGEGSRSNDISEISHMLLRIARRRQPGTDEASAQSNRSRSPPSSRGRRRGEHNLSPDTTSNSQTNTDASANDTDDVKKLSMKERLAMWKKRKEMEKTTDSPGRSPAASASAELPASSASRASSVLDDSNNSSRFVTAPSSVASDSEQSTNGAVFSTPLARSTLSKTSATPKGLDSSFSTGIKLKPSGGTLSSASGAKPPAKFGKMKLGKPAFGIGVKRTLLKQPSSLASSVFDFDIDDTDVAQGMDARGRKRKLASLSPIPASASAADTSNKQTSKVDAASEAAAMDIDNVSADADPLEAYMQTMQSQMNNDMNASTGNENNPGDAKAGDSSGPNLPDAKQTLVEDDIDDMDRTEADVEDVLALAAKRLKKKELASVDHSKMNYGSFKRNFYIEPAELRNLTPEEVELMRIDLGGIKIRGVDAPKPATSWSHFGLPAACADVIKHQGFEKPTPVQAQAIPAILSGRDVISVAKTGSGKTLAFILPMLRHIKAQRPLEQGEGPIGLIMTPTRELAVQIHREFKPFLRPLGLRAVCTYGGSAIKDQIGELKRGCEIIVCTPGRLIDLLCANSGRVTNLHRVTYLVLDEADRMFDMGFEPQVTKIVQIVRPSRQTVLFSATFPRQMEALARKILRRPLEIVVGGRSLIPPEVAQHVSVVENKDKFLRLLGILGESFNRNSETLALIFVDRQEAADLLLRDLMRRGYVCNSLHGGKDQTDRDQAVADFKNHVFSVLIATSVAARGLDVRGLNVVINYDCPNHMEDLIHRVGRTGRAGNRGDAYTFITPEQDRYATEVVKAMKLSGLTPPENVQALANSFLEKVRQGKERHSSSKSGFGGKGLEKLDKDRSMVKKIQKVTYGATDGDATDGDEDGDDERNQVELDSDGEIVISSKHKTKSKDKDQSKNGEVVRRVAKAENSRRSSISGSSASSIAPANGTDNKQQASPMAVDSASIVSGVDDASGGMSAAARAAVLAAQAAARRLNIATEPNSNGINGQQKSTPLSIVDQINQQLGITSPLSTNRRDSGAPTAATLWTHARNPRDNNIRSNTSGNAAAVGDGNAPSMTAAATSTSAASIPVGEYGCELDINDYPQTARWKATNRDTLTQIIEQTGVAITTRGIFVPPGRPVPEGERRLYLSIEGDSERSVEQAKTEFKRILTEATVHIMEQDARAGGSGRYSVV